MVKDRVTPNLKTFTQLLDSLPDDTQAEQVRVEYLHTESSNMGVTGNQAPFRHFESSVQPVDSHSEESLSIIMPELTPYETASFG